MDASVQDYIWNGSPIVVETAEWKPEDWVAQICEFVSRNRDGLSSWRGFRDTTCLVTDYLQERFYIQKVVLDGAVTHAIGFEKIPCNVNNVHARIFGILPYNVVKDGMVTQDLLLLTRRGDWVRLALTFRQHRTVDKFPAITSIVVTEWELCYLSEGCLEQIISSRRSIGPGILFEFRKIMQETEGALQADLKKQRVARQEYDRVLSRMKF